MGKDILHRVGNGGHCGCETVSHEVLPQVEIPEKWTQEPPCFAITIGVRLRSHTNHLSLPEPIPRMTIVFDSWGFRKLHMNRQTGLWNSYEIAYWTMAPPYDMVFQQKISHTLTMNGADQTMDSQKHSFMGESWSDFCEHFADKLLYYNELQLMQISKY